MIEPHAVFRWLPREKRAAYSRAMHRTLTVKVRDLHRAIRRLARVIHGSR